ncbi:MAG: class I SAM-dependent methyltransferase [Acidimicrobiaceae bacterium]|nr:class I SAM-dependent methyltransferase [Acidimicrobiaceae bacterium]
MPSGSGQEELRAVLGRAQELGFLGPGALDPQIDRSLAFTAATAPPESALDLGSGGGIPGLVLALAWPASRWVLLDGSLRRCQFLREAVGALRLDARVEVVASRAEEAGRGPLRGSRDLVVARGFGPAAVTAECAAPLLKLGGHLVVAEPPGGAPKRWPAQSLAALGLEVGPALTEPVALQVLKQIALCPDRFPRRVGIPAKRPLFR